jgi:hypothetical protein
MARLRLLNPPCRRPLRGQKRGLLRGDHGTGPHGAVSRHSGKIARKPLILRGFRFLQHGSFGTSTRAHAREADLRAESTS